MSRSGIDRRKRQRMIDHAIERAKERYGLLLSPSDLEELCYLILAQIDYKPLSPIKGFGPHTFSVTTMFRGKPVRVIYDYKYQTVATFLTWEGREETT